MCRRAIDVSGYDKIAELFKITDLQGVLCLSTIGLRGSLVLVPLVKILTWSPSLVGVLRVHGMHCVVPTRDSDQ
jgi:hypothetical protein